MNKLLYGSIRPEGWLRRQLEIQARGLSGHLDKIWPDVRDSAWIGGDREGWERVPYWLDGFIPLAHLLQDQDLIARADRYVQCIVDRQQADGWICPCNADACAAYDLWAVLLIGKVLALMPTRPAVRGMGSVYSIRTPFSPSTVMRLPLTRNVSYS